MSTAYNVADNTEFENEDVLGNKYILRSYKVFIIACTLVWILNELEIFIVYKPLLRITMVLCNSILIAMLLIIKEKHLQNPITKYVLLIALVVCITIICSLLTFHVTMLWAAPLFMAGHYKNNKVAQITFISMFIGITISAYTGYMFGLADMNLLIDNASPMKK